MDQISIRMVRQEDLAGCCALEAACFPPDEAADEASVRRRIKTFAQGFLVAECPGDPASEGAVGRIAGMINAGATDSRDLADEAFKQMIGHDPDGENMVVFSLSVLPSMRGQGLGRRLMERFVEQSRELGKRRILLLCKEGYRTMYERFGFAHAGLSASTHGGAVWHEMHMEL